MSKQQIQTNDSIHHSDEEREKTAVAVNFADDLIIRLN